MKLTYDNIDFVRVRTHNEKPYGYFVRMKSNRASDHRDYALYKDGKTTTGDYKKEWLPKTIQKFLENHQREEDTAFNKMLEQCGSEEDFKFYIYK